VGCIIKIWIQEEQPKKLTYGFIKEDGGLIQKQLEVPETFYTMIKIFYPDQKWDRKFVAGLAKRIPILKVAKNI